MATTLLNPAGMVLWRLRGFTRNGLSIQPCQHRFALLDESKRASAAVHMLGLCHPVVSAAEPATPVAAGAPDHKGAARKSPEATPQLQRLKKLIAL